MTSAGEFLKGVTTTELDEIVAQDIHTEAQYAAIDVDALPAFMLKQYPQLVEFAKHTVMRLPSFETMNVEEVQSHVAAILFTVGAVCRAAEIAELPEVH